MIPKKNINFSNNIISSNEFLWLNIIIKSKYLFFVAPILVKNKTQKYNKL